MVFENKARPLLAADIATTPRNLQRTLGHLASMTPIWLENEQVLPHKTVKRLP
jgi:hypothetical protein